MARGVSSLTPHFLNTPAHYGCFMGYLHYVIQFPGISLLKNLRQSQFAEATADCFARRKMSSIQIFMPADSQRRRECLYFVVSTESKCIAIQPPARHCAPHE